MKKIIWIIVLSVLSVFLFSQDFRKIPGGERIKKITSAASEYSVGSSQSFTYDDKGKLVKIESMYNDTPRYADTFEYDKDGNIIKKTRFNPEQTAVDITTYEYKNGKKVKSIVTNQDNKEISNTFFSYNDKGILISESIKDTNNPTSTFVWRSVMVYANDPKNIPLTALYFFEGELYERSEWKYPSDKNGSQAVCISYNSDNKSTATLTCQYNKNNMMIMRSYLNTEDWGRCVSYRDQYEYDAKGNLIKVSVYSQDIKPPVEVYTIEWEKGKMDKAVLSDIVSGLSRVGC